MAEAAGLSGLPVSKILSALLSRGGPGGSGSRRRPHPALRTGAESSAPFRGSIQFLRSGVRRRGSVDIYPGSAVSLSLCLCASLR